MSILLLSALGPACKEDPSSSASDSREAPAPMITPRAKVGPLSGKVSLKRAAVDEWREAERGMELLPGDKVRTEPGAHASLTFVDGSSVTLAEDSLIAIGESTSPEAGGPSELTVLKGRINAALEDAARQSLTVTTPSAKIRAGREIVFQ